MLIVHWLYWLIGCGLLTAASPIAKATKLGKPMFAYLVFHGLFLVFGTTAAIAKLPGF